ncbi:MAG: hypothetical protein KDB01_27090, partial [Planctomycetaceae bacterium]|nr:hypothetical protein [Planctomycetaceae bacterium]
MVSSSLNVGEMHLLKAIIEILNQNLGKPMILDELGEELKTRGFKVGKGMVRVIDDLEFKLGGKPAIRSL